MNKMDVLGMYFNAGSAERESTFIDNVFVPLSDIEKILDINPNEMKIIIGNKGSGKSATLKYIKKENNDQNIPSLLLKMDDLGIGSYGSDTSISEVKEKVYERLVYKISACIGSDLPKYVKEDEMPLLQAAIQDGGRDTDYLRKFLSMFGEGIAKANVDEYYRVRGENSYYRALNNYLIRDDKVLFLLIDDVEQAANRDNVNYHIVIWGILLAFSKIAEKFPNIRPITTILTETWRGLCVVEAKGDQIDHLQPMSYTLNPEKEDLSRILMERLNFCRETLTLQRTNDKTKVCEDFFEGSHCTLYKRGGDSMRRYWSDYLITASRYRPRDTINLVNLLSKNAKTKKRDIITDEDIQDIAYDYSKGRITVLCQENQDRCPQLVQVIDYFHKAEDENKISGLMSVLKELVGSRGLKIVVDGKTITTSDKDVLRLLDLLFDIEFIFPRDVDINADEKYKYIRPFENPNLIKFASIQDLEPYAWDIHPSYRTYIQSVRLQIGDRKTVKREHGNKKGSKVRKR